MGINVAEALNRAVEASLLAGHPRPVVTFSDALSRNAFCRSIEDDIGMPSGELQRFAIDRDVLMYNGVEFRARRNEPAFVDEHWVTGG